MQVSIIIPIFKAKHYIKRCLQSIVKQTFSDYEVVLIDDASPDNSLSIAEQFLQQNNIEFQSAIHQTNQKQSTARNTGIKMAKGKYLMFMDNDDELAHNDVLKQFYEAIEREDVDFVSANFNVAKSEADIHKETYTKGIKHNKKLANSAVLEALLYTEIAVSPWNKLLKKDFIIQNSLYFPKDMRIEDRLWGFNMCSKATSCYCLSNYNYNYYYNGNPDSVHANFDQGYIDDLYFSITEILQAIENKKEFLEKRANAYACFIIKTSIDILAIPFIMQNKPLWKKHYQKLRKIYSNSALNIYEKRFTLPAFLAYFVFTESIKPYQFTAAKLYLRTINLINAYNWKGNQATIKKLKEKWTRINFL